jgi:DNA-binding response OmpR family regulator
MTPRETSFKGSTIFLVDDEPSWLELMGEILRTEGFRVITAETGETALENLRTVKPDLILSDLRMPSMNGFDFFEKVRHIPKLNSVPFVFMSSIDDIDAKRVAKQIGADGYVTKPFDSREARSVVSELLTQFENR